MMLSNASVGRCPVRLSQSSYKWRRAGSPSCLTPAERSFMANANWWRIGQHPRQQLQIIGNHDLSEDFGADGFGFTKHGAPQVKIFVESLHAFHRAVGKAFRDIQTMNGKDVRPKRHDSAPESPIIERHADPVVIAQEKDAVLACGRLERRVFFSKLAEWIVGFPGGSGRLERQRVDEIGSG